MRAARARLSRRAGSGTTRSCIRLTRRTGWRGWTWSRCSRRTPALSLGQIGPSFVLNPIRIFAGSLGGPTLYQNPSYETPTALRRMAKVRLSGKYKIRKAAQAKRKTHLERNPEQEDPLEDVFKHDD